MSPSPASSPPPAGGADQPAKEALRLHYARRGTALPPNVAGVLAQHLRSLPAYRQAGQIFVSPAPVLKQIRINALVDGKSLLMPGPSLHAGFYLLAPFTIPFPSLSQAVTSKGMTSYGRKLATRELADLRLDLLVADALAVDRRGYQLADGNGFFDLAAAILAATGALTPNCLVVALGPAAGRDLPADPWDVPADYRLDDAGLTPCQPPPFPRPGPILWPALPPVRIRRITPLWQLQEQAVKQPPKPEQP
jgi:5-formyltetrahydrofolate cyclo-ligase